MRWSGSRREWKSGPARPLCLEGERESRARVRQRLHTAAMLDPDSGREAEDGNPAARRNPHHPPVTSQRAHRGRPIAEEQPSNQTWGRRDGGRTSHSCGGEAAAEFDTRFQLALARSARWTRRGTPSHRRPMGTNQKTVAKDVCCHDNSPRSIGDIRNCSSRGRQRCQCANG